VSTRNSAIIIGGLIGAVVGATAAWAYTTAKEGAAPGAQLRLKAGAPDYVKVGITLLGMVRQVTELFKPG
jgi:hypothetical protein